MNEKQLEGEHAGETLVMCGVNGLGERLATLPVPCDSRPVGLGHPDKLQVMSTRKETKKREVEHDVWFGFSACLDLIARSCAPRASYPARFGGPP